MSDLLLQNSGEVSLVNMSKQSYFGLAEMLIMPGLLLKGICYSVAAFFMGKQQYP